MTAAPDSTLSSSAVGTVHLVGAGPGDTGLLTLRADALLRACDCVVYDYLVSPGIMERVPEQAHRVYVGKRGHADSISQDTINAKLVECARRYRTIVRLKGGDPFVFGRGGEEADYLAAAQVPFSIVPGVTSGVAVPAYAGIPITHRAKSSAVVFATGHRKPGADDAAHWRALAHIETIVLYMGMQKLPELSAALIEHGRDPETPACVIQWGTYAHQQCATGTLRTIADVTREAGIGSPAITVIGDVVAYRDRIRWFDNRPLSGKRVVITRSRNQTSVLQAEFEQLGATITSLPLQHQGPPTSWTDFDAAIDQGNYSWIAFTSANGVHYCWDHLRQRGLDSRIFARARIAAVGQATATALAGYGLHADLVPESASGAALGDALAGLNIGGQNILLLQADNAHSALRDRILAAHATPICIATYRNIPETSFDPELLQGADAITFASSATAQLFVDALGKHLTAFCDSKTRCYAIGPETAKGMLAVGLPMHGMAYETSVAGLAQIVAADLQASTP